MKYKITNKHFEGLEFGKEGTISEFPDWTRSVISKIMLREHLVKVAEAVNPIYNQYWISKAQDTLMEDVLGTKDNYTVITELELLRDIPENKKSSEQRLVQRALSLVSYN